MTTVHVGLPALKGDLGRYAQRFDLLEVRPIDTPLPRPSRLAKWRKEVPPAFVFSVVVPSVVADLRTSPEADAALATTLETAVALQARCLVITTPVHVTPTALHKKRLAALVARMPRDAVTVAWEPRGVWDVAEAQELAKQLEVSLVVDAAQERPPRGPVLYTRLRGLGAQSRLSAAAVERARESLSSRREVFVVIEAAGAAQVAAAMAKPLPGPARMSTATVVRPQVKLSAEDEEQ